MFKQAVIADTVNWDVEDPANFDCFYPDMSIKTDKYQFTANCGDLAFYNKGTSTMVVNNIEYAPGTGLSIGCPRGAMNVGKFTVSFVNTGAQINKAFIMR